MMQQDYTNERDLALTYGPGVEDRGVMQNARIVALYNELLPMPEPCTVGALIERLAYRKNPWGWTPAKLEQALRDLNDRGFVRVRVGRGGIFVSVGGWAR
jgi:hypothetical protein